MRWLRRGVRPVEPPRSIESQLAKLQAANEILAEIFQGVVGEVE